MGFHGGSGKRKERQVVKPAGLVRGFTGHVRELARKATLGFVTVGAVWGQGKCLPDVFRKILREGEVKARPAVRTPV